MQQTDFTCTLGFTAEKLTDIPQNMNGIIVDLVSGYSLNTWDKYQYVVLRIRFVCMHKID